MTAQQIIDQANLEIGQSTGGLSDAKSLDILNEGYVDFTRFTKCLYKQETDTHSAYESIVNLPTDFLQSIQFRWGDTKQLFPKSERDLDYHIQKWVFDVGTPENVVYWNYNELRLKPVPSAAATFVNRYNYIPEDLGLSDSPNFPKVWHEALVHWQKSQLYLIFREYSNADESWKQYDEYRMSAKVDSKTGTPDTLQTQEPTTIFNYQYWDQEYRRGV